ncbi:MULTISPECIES: LacI family DNA-binding transcriptional regulator [unclassified Mesobacillus]|uniref:LacI family DNA-binding transcriptional regulator n=1 Tax=unclassified Mesobacillus TaxID=2675270 RepID=UPI002040F4AE|nr:MULTISPECIES: LacI family DNA-binding transcriptional regulator [unclassified Mesobacillus]MCM3124217.1 LacI family transcriptional regulator [Mesobacillus sp. MER 33]MCM3234066.1 LacI family transcriptional regulator [Mesobacillus sp. MER 48]
MKKVTMQDVAEKAGVSKSTVSQYINNRYEFMAEPTRKRIQEAIRELGYIPNFVAKSLKQKKSSTIGVIVANILHTFSTEIIRAIEDACELSHFHMFVCNADDNPEKERDYINMLLAKQVDGLIIFPTADNKCLYEELKQSNFPVVFVDRKIEQPIYPTLMLNNERAAEIAVRELLKKGHNKIGAVSMSISQKVSPRVERITGFKRTLEENGIAPNEDWITAADRKEIGPALEKLWKQEDRPEAFFATNDLSLIELLKFLRKKNLKVGEDVSVIAVDDSDFLEIAATPISAIKQPTFQIGREAAEELFHLIAEGKLEDSYEVRRYDPVLIERESVQVLGEKNNAR